MTLENSKIAIIGLGYVGLPLAIEFGKKYKVLGFDIKQLGWMSTYGHRLQFDENGLASCPESGENYQFLNGIVTKI